MKLKRLPNKKKPSSFEIGPVTSIKGLQKQKLPYIVIWIIYYAWVVSFVTWWTASPLSDNVFSTELRSLLHTIMLLSSGIFIFIIRKEWFVKTARIGATLVIVGISLFLIASNPQMELLCVVIIGIALLQWGFSATHLRCRYRCWSYLLPF